MSDDSIAHLEQEIEATRARIKARLNVVASPDAIADLGDTVKREAVKAKDAWVERTRDAGVGYAQNIASSLKQKAMENPLAALSIAAGIGWKLWRDPPIAAALIGLGAAGLVTGKPGNILSDAESVDSDAERIEPSALLVDAKGAVREAVERTEQAVSAGGQHVSRMVSDIGDMLPDNTPRNQVLLGVAGLAVAAAVGMAVQRKGSR